jgi:fatty acid desaturase
METAAGEAFRPDARRMRDGAADWLAPDELAELTRLDDRRSLAMMAPPLLALAAVLTAAAALWTPWAVIAAIPVVAALQHAIFVLVHDAAHYRLLSDRRLNDLLGRVLGASVGISMCAYRVVHRLHHNDLYGPGDPDTALHGGYPRGRAYLRRKLAADLLGVTAPKTYGYFFGTPAANDDTGGAQRPLDDTAPSLRAAALADRRTVIAVQIGLPLAALAIGGGAGLLKYAVLWVLPAVTVLQAILRLRAIAEHGAPIALDSPLTAARTHRPGPMLRFWLFPQQVGYHVEHHLYPAVPRYRLPDLHARLAARGAFGAVPASGFGSTWRRVYADRGAQAAIR